MSPTPCRERQDSVYNALQKVDRDASLVCIHDAARPLVTKDSVYKVSRMVHAYLRLLSATRSKKMFAAASRLRPDHILVISVAVLCCCGVCVL